MDNNINNDSTIFNKQCQDISILFCCSFKLNFRNDERDESANGPPVKVN